MNKILFSICLCSTFFCACFSQNIIKGKVISDVVNIGEVYITNTATNIKAVVDANGFFSINANPNHILVFSGLKVAKKTVNLKPLDFSIALFEVKLYPRINQLDEVEITNYPNINAVSLGIISKNIRKYTPAERRLVAGSAGIGIVQLLNAINGRTDELKKNIEVEKKQKMLEDVSILYPDEFYTEKLKIPQYYIKGFYLFVISDQKLMNSIKNKNKTQTEFLFTQLALKYNKITENDKK